MSDPKRNYDYDLAIIGGGISGLTAGALAGKLGLKCCLLEKESHTGGYLSGFSKNGFHFDTAIHWLNQFNQNEMVGRIFSLIGSDSPEIQVLNKIHRFKGENYDYTLSNNPDELKQKLITDYPHESKGIVKFFRVAKGMGKGTLAYSKLFRTHESMNFFENLIFKIKLLRFYFPLIKYIFYSGEGVTKGLNKFFKDKNLHKLYSSEKDLLSCLFPIAWAYHDGYQIPEKGGARVFIHWLKYVNEFFGNDIILNAEVKKLHIENNSCKYINYSNNGDILSVKSKYVISAHDIETLYTRLLPPNIISNKLKEKLQNAVLYSSAFTVNIALNCTTESLGINEELISITKENIQRNDHDSGDPYISDISVIAPSSRDKSLTPEGKGLLTLYIPAYIEYKNYWGTERNENGDFVRGETYNQLKHEVAEILIQRVEKELNIKLKPNILFYDISTPITYYRYTGNKNGTMMGARYGKQNMQAKIAHHQTKVKNLIIGGQWADLGGGVPIAVKSAANAVLLTLKKENKKAFELLANYMDGKISVEKFNSSDLVRDYDNSWTN
jgi:prolycopene isomerase